MTTLLAPEPDRVLVPDLRSLQVKIFADGADLDSIEQACQKGIVKGFTTNPTLMARSGVTNYLAFAREMLRIVPVLPVSFEVFSDELPEMKRQALVLHGLGSNVYIKIPVTNTRGESTAPIVRELAAQGLKLNVTALFTLDQVRTMASVLDPGTPSIVSVFAGRVADSGRDPVLMMERCLKILADLPRAELLWASTREAYNIIQADAIGCHIITVTPDIISKAMCFNKNLDEFSLETVHMFYRDAQKSGYTI